MGEDYLTLELNTEQIVAAIQAWLLSFSLPVDWDKGVTFKAYDGADDPEPLLVTDLRATMEIAATGNGQQATVSSP